MSLFSCIIKNRKINIVYKIKCWENTTFKVNSSILRCIKHYNYIKKSAINKINKYIN